MPTTPTKMQQPQTPQTLVVQTPQSKGSSSHSTSETLERSQHTQEVYADYLKHDIATEQELSFDNFMKLILNEPDWSSKYSADVDQIVEDGKFKALLANYPISGVETGYYHPFVELANRVLEKNNSRHRIAFCRNDPTHIIGSLGARKPDVITALRISIFDPNPRISADSCSKKGPEKYPFHWAELLTFAEFKKYDSASQPGSRSSSQAKASAPTSTSRSESGKKRSATISDSDSANKRPKTGPSKEDVKIQCASYALEMLSNGGLRTHVLGLLVSKNVLQLLYFDRSIFIVSEPLNFRDSCREFIALLLVLEGLSNTEWGFVPGFDLPFNVLNGGSAPSKDLFSTKSMKLSNGITLDFGEILSRHHGLVGRGTCVIRASVVNPPGGWTSVVAVKISSPASSRKSETELLRVARGKAIGEHSWVLSHLPKILHHEDLDTLNSPRHRLADFFNDKDAYELRALRLIVFDELYPITELKTVAELAKALRDIFNCYRWLYQEAGIFHRDISLYNLMYRREGGVVYGVLNDFDLSTFVNDPSPSSKQRTGTKPYMAYELLEEGVVHRYRHDLESFFYVILILTSRFENGQEIKNPPLQKWFSLDSEPLANLKHRLITSSSKTWPSPTVPYAGFRKWLEPMGLAFSDGFYWARRNDNEDSETLGDHVTFEKMAEILNEVIV